MVISDARFIELQIQISTLAALVADMPLDEYIEWIGKADALGPILSPTLWMEKHHVLDDTREMAEALRHFQRIVCAGIARESARASNAAERLHRLAGAGANRVEIAAELLSMANQPPPDEGAE